MTRRPATWLDHAVAAVKIGTVTAALAALTLSAVAAGHDAPPQQLTTIGGK
jgi:hypothetical protein